jgi:hypothetical protein
MVEMEKKATTKDSIESIVESIFRSKHDSCSDTSLVDTPIGIFTPPEEGVRLIHAFIRIKQPELCAAIIKLSTKLADEL